MNKSARIIISGENSVQIHHSIGKLVENLAERLDKTLQISTVTNPAPYVAVITVEGVDLSGLKSELATFSAGRQLDVVLLEEDQYRTSGRILLIMDVDSTVIQEEVIELLAARAGVQTAVKEVTDRAMAGELDFEQSLRERVRLLAGLPDSIYSEVFQDVNFTQGAHELVSRFHSLGHEVALVSGGFTPVVKMIAENLGIKHFKANELESMDSRLTGNVQGKVVDRAAKAENLRQLAAELKIDLRNTIAVGDGANDLDMLAAAGLGVAFRAKPIVQTSADVSLNFSDLSAVLYLVDLDHRKEN